MRPGALALGGFLVAGAACEHAAPVPVDVASRLAAAPDGFVTGEVSGLSTPRVLDQQDFVYAIDFARNGRRAAFSHLGAHAYKLGVWNLGAEPKQLQDFDVNAVEFDVEAVAFDPAGERLATASRDGWIRVFPGAVTHPELRFDAKQPLVAVVFAPDGKYLLAGTATGQLLVLSFPELRLVFADQAHSDELRAIAVSDEGTVFTGGWDQRVRAYDLSDGKLNARGDYAFNACVNDVTVDRSGQRLGVAFSAERAQRNPEVYARERRGEPAPDREGDSSAILDARDGRLLAGWHHHRGVVSTAAISPDGQTLATGGWDQRVLVESVGRSEWIASRTLGWSVRRVRFSRDGSRLAVGAWTHQNPLGDHHSDPSALVYEVEYRSARLSSGL